MIELVMVFALGFLIAGLLALAFAPIFWARAVRLSVRRLEMQLPVSMREILAERDQVRAEGAVAQRRIELKAEALHKDKAQMLADLGRRTIRIDEMEKELAAIGAAKAALETDLSRLNRAHAELSTEAFSLSKELYDLTGLHDRQRISVNSLTAARDQLAALADEQKASIASLEACQQALEARLADATRNLEATRTKLSNNEAEATLLSTHLARAKDDLQASEKLYQAAIAKYERQGVRVGELELQLQHVQEMLSDSLSKLRAHALKSEGYETDLRRSREREDELQVKHATAVERMRSSERGLTGRIDRLRSENAALQGALETARKEHASLSRELRDNAVAARKEQAEPAPEQRVAN